LNYKKQYQRERKRIQKQISRMRKRGYNVNIELPAIPRKITAASVRRLQKITTPKLYEVSTKGQLSGRKARQQERFESARKAAQTRRNNRIRRNYFESRGANYAEYDEYTSVEYFSEMVIENFLQPLKEFADKPGAKIIIAKVDDYIDKYGKSRVAQEINNMNEGGQIISWKEIYERSTAIEFMKWFAYHMPQLTNDEKEQIFESINEDFYK